MAPLGGNFPPLLRLLRTKFFVAVSRPQRGLRPPSGAGDHLLRHRFLVSGEQGAALSLCPSEKPYLRGGCLHAGGYERGGSVGIERWRFFVQRRWCFDSCPTTFLASGLVCCLLPSGDQVTWKAVVLAVRSDHGAATYGLTAAAAAAAAIVLSMFCDFSGALLLRGRGL